MLVLVYSRSISIDLINWQSSITDCGLFLIINFGFTFCKMNPKEYFLVIFFRVKIYVKL